MDNLRKTIFNLQRFTIVQQSIQQDTSASIPRSYAFAWAKKIFPYFHDDDFSHDHADQFDVTRDQISMATKFVVDHYNNGELFNFYEYEGVFGNKISSPFSEFDRHTIMNVFRYYYLDERFSKDFWDKLLEQTNHPSEAALICRKFTVDELYLV